MKTETVYITCDLDQTVGASEVRWQVNGTHYAIDLCDSCRAVFTNLMAPYIEAGHKVKFIAEPRRELPTKPKGHSKKAKLLFDQVVKG